MLTVLAVLCIDVNAVEFIQTDSDFGDLFLIQNQTMDGEWSVLYVEKGIYFRRDSSQSFCVNHDDYYGRCTAYMNFLPKIINVRQCSLKTFPSGLFQSWFFKQLQHLRIVNVEISEFQRVGLFGADALTLFDLSHNVLTEMPSKAFSNARNLTLIDLSHNQIASMPPDVFKTEEIVITTKAQDISNLESILLNNNKLTFIDPEWFLSVVKLTTLTLNDNLLTEFNACSAFGTSIALRSLQLQNNEFSVIRTNGLSDKQCLNQLDSFDISNNLKNSGTRIIRANAETINISNTNLRECFVPYNAIILRADHNRIDSIVFDELPNTELRELYLNHNKINSTDFLFDLEDLQIIDLSHNELGQINEKVFEKMPKLTTLNIAYNKLVTIDTTFLKSTDKLTHLDISNNLLSGLFKLNVKAVALSVLNIANNNFTLIQHNLKTQTPNLTSIDMNGNHYYCDDLASMILFLNLDHITPIIRSDGDFGNADNVRGIKCHQNQEKLIGVDSTKSGYQTTKEQLVKTIDDKFVKLENKLIDLFNYVKTSEVTDNTIVF